jgi:hypothetical protein
MVFSSGSLVTQGQRGAARKSGAFFAAVRLSKEERDVRALHEGGAAASLVVLICVIATLDTRGLQRGGHSVHYKTQLPRTVNVQVIGRRRVSGFDECV